MPTTTSTRGGDSGGPAIRRTWDEEAGAEVFTLVGVVSGNPAGCLETRLYPDYYTFIGHPKVKYFSGIHRS